MPNTELLAALLLVREYLSTGRVTQAREQVNDLIDHVETETKETCHVRDR